MSAYYTDYERGLYTIFCTKTYFLVMHSIIIIIKLCILKILQNQL
jgi:hypothetical protein